MNYWTTGSVPVPDLTDDDGTGMTGTVLTADLINEIRRQHAELVASQAPSKVRAVSEEFPDVKRAMSFRGVPKPLEDTEAKIEAGVAAPEALCETQPQPAFWPEATEYEDFGTLVSVTPIQSLGGLPISSDGAVVARKLYRLGTTGGYKLISTIDADGVETKVDEEFVAMEPFNYPNFEAPEPTPPSTGGVTLGSHNYKVSFGTGPFLPVSDVTFGVIEAITDEVDHKKLVDRIKSAMWKQFTKSFFGRIID